MTLCQSSQERGILCREKREREREGGGEVRRAIRLERAPDIAPLRVPPRCCKKGPRILVLDLSRKPLTHVGRPGI